MKKKTIVACILLLISSTILAGCGAKKEIKEEITSEIPQFEEEREEVQYASVSTPYGDLYFQDRWEDAMITEQTEDGENLIVSFKSEMNGETYQLFDIIIGEMDEEAAAVITDSQGNSNNIYVQMHELTDMTGLSESDVDQIYAMQEEINSIISFLE